MTKFQKFNVCLFLFKTLELITASEASVLGLSHTYRSNETNNVLLVHTLARKSSSSFQFLYIDIFLAEIDVLNTKIQK